MKRPPRDQQLVAEADLSDNSISAESVAAYLRAHPDFFSQFPGLLEELYLPHESGSAISLVTRQVAVLRDRNIDMRNRLSSQSRTAHDNDRLFERTRALVVDAIAATDMSGLHDTVVAHLAREFGVEHVTLNWFIDAAGQSTNELERAQAAIGHLLGSETVTGTLRDTEFDYLFPDVNPAPASAAVVALRGDRLLGVLALGASDADRFRPGMGTLFLRFTADIVSRLTSRLVR